MQSDHMKRALQSRRGRGIEIDVILGHPGEEMHAKDDNKKTDLAPPPGHPLDVDHGAEQVVVPAQEQHSQLSGMQDSDLLDGMSDYDKENISERNPRSLGERARQAMMMGAAKK